jgi:transcription antitermination factor NusG
LKHYFEYNGDKLTIDDGKLKDFATQIETQLNSGRKTVTINIYSSASYVPTRTFGTNEKLAKSRANRIQSELNTYFANKGMKDKVKVVIVSAVVAGPKYDKDPENTAKYHDFQFIELKTQ